MRAFRFMTMSFVLIFALVICVGISKGYTFTYYGELCWLVAETGDPDTSIFKLAVSDMGGGHFILNGKEVDTSGDFDFYIIHGNAEVIGSDVIITLNGSGSDAIETEVSTYHVTLSSPSLTGTYDEIWTFYAKNQQLMVTGHVSGTFTFVSCP